ncbi:MAG TPA: hypothetical protein VHA76_10805, partial [Solirubrobacterales bacterium]|nr:hypothetical protein [Solirubrobacterales bacterium]
MKNRTLSSNSRSAGGESPLRHLSALSLLVFLAMPAFTVFAASTATAGAVTKAPSAGGTVAKVMISKATANGTRVTIAGRVKPAGDASGLSPTDATVLLTLKGTGKAETFSVRPDNRWRFKATKATKLTGRLTVTALLKIAGSPAGRQVRKSFAGPAAKAAPVHGGAGSGKSGTGGGASG